MNILHLNLKSCWYDLIEQGIKTEEYREIKPFYLKRLRAFYATDVSTGAKEILIPTVDKDMDWANGIIDILNELEESVPLEDVEIIRRIKKRL